MWTFGQFQHVLAFCVQVGWLANGQFEIFLPPSYHPSCNCEFLLNSPSGLAFGHNHFLLNPVSGILYSLALSSLPFAFIPIYSTLWFYTTLLGDFCNLRGFTLDGVQLDVQNKFEHRCQRGCFVNSVNCPP